MNDNDIRLDEAITLLCYVPGEGFYKRYSIRHVDEIDRKKLFSLCLIDSPSDSCRRTILGDKLIMKFVRCWGDSYTRPYFKEEPPFVTLLEFLENDSDFMERYKRLLQERSGELSAPVPAVPADITSICSYPPIFANDKTAPALNNSETETAKIILATELYTVVREGFDDVRDGLKKVVERLDKPNEIQTPQDYTEIKDHIERRRIMYNDGMKPSDISRWEKEHRNEIDSSNYPLPSTDVNAIKKSLQRQRKK